MKERIFLSPPHILGREREYVAKAFDSNYIAPAGPWIKSLESRVSSYLGKGFYSCALSSATGGLDLIFDLLGVGKGDAVICSDLTFIASIGPAIHRGAIPYFVDCEKDSWQMDPSALDSLLASLAASGKRVKAVVAVDLFGCCCDYSKISEICKKFNVPLIEDAAEALGASYLGDDGLWHAAGTAGAASVFSFNGNKIITSSGGGLLVSSDKAFIDDARKLSEQSRENFAWYEHVRVGYNYRMSNVSAAICCGQFEVLAAKVSRRREIFELYSSLLPELSFMGEPEWCHSTRWLTTALLPDGVSPVSVVKALEEENVESRPIWKPMHMQPVFSDSFVTGNGVVSKSLFDRGICLPSGDGMSDGQVEEVAMFVRRALSCL